MNKLQDLVAGDNNPKIIVKKRSLNSVEFDDKKITNAIYRAICDTRQRRSLANNEKKNLAVVLKDKVVKNLLDNLSGIISIEAIQDEVEHVLSKGVDNDDTFDIAKQYILYRDEKKKLRKKISEIINSPYHKEVPLTVNSAGVFAARYLIRDLDTEEITETMPELFDRIARHIAMVDVMFHEEIFDKNRNEEMPIDSLESILEIYDSYNYRNSQPNNRNYIIHLYNRFKQLKNNINITFNELFFILFTRFTQISHGKDIEEDINALGYDYESLVELSYILLPFFKNRCRLYYNLMTSLNFLPNTPTLMNSGTKNGQLCACYTLAMPDNIPGIGKTIVDTMVIFQGAGGVGINFSDVRELYSAVDNVPRAATGPMSFQKIIDFITDIIKQGGKRKGANMGILETWHPEIETFINMKTIPKNFENYNISVGINNDFWEKYDRNEDYCLKSPHTHKVTKTIPSHALMRMIASAAWKSAEPGIIYFNNINRYNPLYEIKGPIRYTNPCAEQSMYANNSCTLGSINLANYVTDSRFNYEKFRQDCYLATNFLNNVMEVNNYPTPEIEEESLKIKRIGLGYMGLAHALAKMGIPYNSKEGFEFIERISSLLTFHTYEKSISMAVTRGAHHYWEEMVGNSKLQMVFAGYTENDLTSLFKQVYPKNYVEIMDVLEQSLDEHGIYNTWTTTLAPTGTISMAADTSNGVEPIYQLVYVKKTSIGRFYYVDKIFERVLKENGLYSEELLDKVSDNYGSCQGIKEIPAWIQRIFVTAVDMSWLDHIYALHKAQKGINNSISKTVNLPENVTVEDFELAYIIARYLGIKGLALYRDNSRDSQVLDNVKASEVREKALVNPHDKDLKEIGGKGTEKKVRLSCTTSDEAIRVLYQEVLPKINKNIAGYIMNLLDKNKIYETADDLRVNTELSCPVCEAGLVRKGNCTSCSKCAYGFCS